ncbi:MAG: MBL fold metallo-hydrolase [Gemmataceae bacterium]
MIKIEHVNFGWLHSPPYPPACCHCFIVQDGDRYVLVDAGIGMADVADPIQRIGEEAVTAAGFQFIKSVTAIAQLTERGVNPAAVTDIVLTHGDPDHVGGLADFPNATIHVSSEELSNIHSENPRYSLSQFSHKPKWKPFSENDGDFFGLPSRGVKTSLATEFRLVPLFGHTLGHCGVAVANGEVWTFHVGDAYYLRAELTNSNHPVDELASLRADDNELRRRSLGRIKALVSRTDLPIVVCGYHDTTELPNTVPTFDQVR